ncbi:carbohydrate ABC transporter permease [Mycoplasma todarodis]|uniref:carbohydrate ABC transporter permease n=1 Tax=Mycoplasma todarodis TaxID=1937191 RepID=UPI003B3350D5
MLKIKLKTQQKLRTAKVKKNAENVGSQVRTQSIIWIIVSNLMKVFALVFFGALILFPFYYMIATSLMTNAEATDAVTTHLAPEKPQWGNFVDAFADGYWMAILYSFLIASITIMVKLVITILLGYAFSIKKYRGKKIVWGFFLSLMMLPEVALLSGQYQMIVRLGWYYGTNILLGLFIPFVASVFSAVMFKNAFEAIPDRTKEAAMIDGAGNVGYFFKVALPMIKPTTLTVIILTAFASWNSYMWPALLLQGKDIQTIPTWVFTTGKDSNGQLLIPIRMAGTTLAILPMLLVYFVFRGRIMKAISRQGSAIKG